MTKFDSEVEAEAFRWIEDNRRQARSKGMPYWNRKQEDLEPETLAIIKDSIIRVHGLVTAPDIAPCGCEIDRTGDIHLCEFHLGYDGGVEATKVRLRDGKES